MIFNSIEIKYILILVEIMPLYNNLILNFIKIHAFEPYLKIYKNRGLSPPNPLSLFLLHYYHSFIY